MKPKWQRESDCIQVTCCLYVGNLAGFASTNRTTDTVENEKAVAAALDALQYWLEQLESCQTDSQLLASIILACTHGTHNSTKAWAQLAQIPEERICCCPDAHQVSQLAPAVHRTELAEHLVLIDAAHVYGAAFDLARFVRLAIIRGKNIAGFACAAEGQNSPPSECQWVTPKDGHTATCPRLLAVSGSQGTTHTDRSWYTVPLYIMKTGAALQTIADEVPGTALASGQFYGLEVAHHWTADQWQRHQEGLSKATAETHQSDAVPKHFQDARLWKYSAVKKNEHPLYSTSSNAIGCVQPSQHELHNSCSGVKGGLAGIMIGGQSGNTGLRTAAKTSKVHPSLDGWL